MTSKHYNPFQKTIPFEDAQNMEELEPVEDSSGQIAINMVLDLQAERTKQATRWRTFAGFALLLVIALAVMNYASRSEQLVVFDKLLGPKSAHVLNADLVRQNEGLNGVALLQLERSLFFYHSSKNSMERRIRNDLALKGTLNAVVQEDLRAFNSMALASGWDLISLPASPPPTE